MLKLLPVEKKACSFGGALDTVPARGSQRCRRCSWRWQRPGLGGRVSGTGRGVSAVSDGVPGVGTGVRGIGAGAIPQKKSD